PGAGDDRAGTQRRSGRSASRVAAIAAGAGADGPPLMMPHIQSIIHPAGLQAARISHLWWVLFGICTVVWFAVAIASLIAISKGRRSASTATDRDAARVVAVCGVLSAIALI